MEDIVYFSFNNWFSGRDYPIGDKYEKLINSHKFSDENWVKENKLVVVTGNIDMSANWCIVLDGNQKLWTDEDGISYVGVIPFLLDKTLL